MEGRRDGGLRGRVIEYVSLPCVVGRTTPAFGVGHHFYQSTGRVTFPPGDAAHCLVTARPRGALVSYRLHQPGGVADLGHEGFGLGTGPLGAVAQHIADVVGALLQFMAPLAGFGEEVLD